MSTQMIDRHDVLIAAELTDAELLAV